MVTFRYLPLLQIIHHIGEDLLYQLDIVQQGIQGCEVTVADPSRLGSHYLRGNGLGSHDLEWGKDWAVMIWNGGRIGQS